MLDLIIIASRVFVFIAITFLIGYSFVLFFELLKDFFPQEKRRDRED